MPITGVDVSRHQEFVNWASVANAGIGFAAIKRTQGVSYKYQAWGDANAPLVQTAGLLLGHYHFLTTFDDGAAQARYFVQTVGNFAGQLAVLDVETNPWNNTNPSSETAHRFADEFKRLVPGHPLILYTGHWYWVGRLGNPHGADIGPLWHSEFESTSAEVADGPELDRYGGWDHATLWQFSNSGQVPGIQGSCDLNLFQGDRAALLALAGVHQPTPPVSQEDDYMPMPVIDVPGDPEGRGTWMVLDRANKELIRLHAEPDPDYGLTGTERHAAGVAAGLYQPVKHVDARTYDLAAIECCRDGDTS